MSYEYQGRGQTGVRPGSDSVHIMKAAGIVFVVLMLAAGIALIGYARWTHAIGTPAVTPSG